MPYAGQVLMFLRSVFLVRWHVGLLCAGNRTLNIAVYGKYVCMALSIQVGVTPLVL
jgi:hypothetical protein